MGIPFWLIYSYWMFGATLLWLGGVIKWSPLISAILSFIGSFFLIVFKREITQANIFILVSHIVPVWLLRNTSIDVVPNLMLFVVYNLVLFANGTDYVSVYKYIFTHTPTTIREYLAQRGLLT